MSSNTPYSTPSAKFRSDADSDAIFSFEQKTQATPEAVVYAQSHNLPLEEAIIEVVKLQNPNININNFKWAGIPLHPDDINIGDVFVCKELEICTNSLLNGYNDKIYNDTYAGHLEGEATYLGSKNISVIHGGDNYIRYGLQHIMTFTKDTLDKKLKPYKHSIIIFSAPWKKGMPIQINELNSTNPIMELRIVDKDNIHKRFVIPQNFVDRNQNTACAGAIVTFDGSMFNVKIICEYCGGFANDVSKSVSDVLSKLMNNTDIVFVEPEVIIEPEIIIKDDNEVIIEGDNEVIIIANNEADNDFVFA